MRNSSPAHRLPGSWLSRVDAGTVAIRPGELSVLAPAADLLKTEANPRNISTLKMFFNALKCTYDST
jgi:hypothetical protein